MIPRYCPTYSLRNLIWAWQMCLTSDPLKLLRSRLAELFAVKHVFLFSSARVALYALLKAYGRPGEVVVPAYNCIAVPEAVLYAGYHPVFADISDNSLNMTADTLGKSISQDTTAVLMTHQFGIPCDVDEILSVCKQYQVLVVEDAAAAIGARFRGRLVGNFGDAAIISFHTTKVISGGIGGALLTDNDELAYKIDRLQQAAAAPKDCWGSFAKAVAWKAATSPWLYTTMLFGYRVLCGETLFEMVIPHTGMPSSFLRLCSRFSAALALVQLNRLDSNLSRRRKLAQAYTDELSGYSVLKLPVVPVDCSPAWIQFPVMVSEKRAFYKYMQRKGIDLSWTFRYSCADSFGLDGFSNAWRAAQTVLGLPTYPSLSDEEAGYICSIARLYTSGLNIVETRSGRSA